MTHKYTIKNSDGRVDKIKDILKDPEIRKELDIKRVWSCSQFGWCNQPEVACFSSTREDISVYNEKLEEKLRAIKATRCFVAWHWSRQDG